MKTNKKSLRLNYDQQKGRLREFITTFEDVSISQSEQCYQKYGYYKYLIEIQKLANHKSKVIEILIEDLQAFFRKDDQKQMVDAFRTNTMRYIRIFEQLISQLMPQRTLSLNPEQEIQQKYTGFLRQQRQQNLMLTHQGLRAGNQVIPYKIYQNYDVCIVFGPGTKINVKNISQIQAQSIGQLIATRAIVVRAIDTKPQLQVATYACDVCGCQNYLEIIDSDYKALTECKAQQCRTNKVNGQLTFLPGNSKFRVFQQLKIQQTPQQLKRGAIPKSTYLEIRGNLTNMAFPGDIVQVQGIVLPKNRSKNELYKDLFFDSYIYVTKITKQKKKYSDIHITEQDKQKVLSVKQSMDEQEFFTKLARSIAPQIYGLESVKKALLLQMAGGVTTQTSDHLRIRGQINVALFGDPGIAKSQLLKHISYVSPRAVYTTGKGSSGVGLTAAIVVDAITKQISLEAGALVLADMGVCCIDEFDKMEQTDRTAIHQVMQQQTVSITKAGIITTLNARTAVLAAANPLFGRYNKKQTVQKNLNLPAALLSRFDLIFILLDQVDENRDRNLAKYICQVHQKRQAPVKDIFDEKFIKTYIAMAKEYTPVIPQKLHVQIIEKYVQKRQIQMDASKQGQSYTTMRSLLGLIRLSQARAKLRFSSEVIDLDVIDCQNIILESQQSVLTEPIKKYKVDTMSRIYDMIVTICGYSQDKKIQIEKVMARCVLRNFTKQQIGSTIKHYQNLGVFSVDETYISLVHV